MQKKTVRSGLVGAGFSATFHYEAIKKVYGTNVDVVGVYAKDEAMAGTFAQERGIQAFDSLDALIEKVDVVHVRP